MATQYTRLSRTLIPMADTRARISIMGQRMAIRIIIWKVICRFATSEVRRVTMEAVENLSMLRKLKLWTWWNMSWRRFLAKPVPALEASIALSTPKAREARAHSTSCTDLMTTTDISCPTMP